MTTPYAPNSPVWKDETGLGDGTLFSAERMNHMEDGIVAATDGVRALEASAGGVPVVTASDYTVADNNQVMFSGAISIETDGYFNINGFLVEVD